MMDTTEARQLPANGTAPAPELHRLTDAEFLEQTREAAQQRIADQLTDESIPPVPDLHAPVLEPIPRARPPFKLMATIKKSSKYYHQGLSDPYNRKSKPKAFAVTSILLTETDSYDFALNGNRYRREDLTLWIDVAGKLKKI